MKIETFYRTCIIVGAILYIAFWFMPYSYGYYNGEIQSLLSYTGFAATIQFSDTVSWIIFFMFLFCSLGMYLYRKIFRTAFLLLLTTITIISSLTGVSVITGVDVMLNDITSILDGAVLAMAYFSPIKDKFY